MNKMLLVCFSVLLNIMVQCCLDTDGLESRQDLIVISPQRRAFIVAWLLDQRNNSRLACESYHDDLHDVSSVSLPRIESVYLRQNAIGTKNKKSVFFGDL